MSLGLYSPGPGLADIIRDRLTLVAWVGWLLAQSLRCLAFELYKGLFNLTGYSPSLREVKAGTLSSSCSRWLLLFCAAFACTRELAPSQGSRADTKMEDAFLSYLSIVAIQHHD